MTLKRFGPEYDLVRLQLSVPPELKHQLKVAAALAGETQGLYMAQAFNMREAALRKLREASDANQ